MSEKGTKRILVASSSDFKNAETISILMNEIKNKLKCNYQVDIFMLPFNYNGDVTAQVLAVKMLEIEDTCEILVAVDYPACLIKHRKKICVFSEFADLSDVTKTGSIEHNCLRYKDGHFYLFDGHNADINKEVERI